MNLVAAVACHFYLALPAAFMQPGNHLLAEPCTDEVNASHSNFVSFSPFQVCHPRLRPPRRLRRARGRRGRSGRRAA